MQRDGSITDDKGQQMTPCTDKPGYWLIEESTINCDSDLRTFQDGSPYEVTGFNFFEEAKDEAFVSRRIHPSSQMTDVRVGHRTELQYQPETVYGVYPCDTPLREMIKMNHNEQSVKISTITYINDIPLDKWTPNGVIKLIQSEETRLKLLTDLNPAIFEKSTAIKALAAKHQKNIDDLLTLLDQLPTV